MRAVVDIEEDAKGRTSLVVTQLPYMVNPDNLAQKIAELVNTGKMSGIADIRDDTSSRTGQRLVIVLKRDAQPRVVLNNLYKHTPAAGHLRLQHARARRRRTAHAQRGPVHQRTGSTTRSRSSSGGPATACARPRSRRTSTAGTGQGAGRPGRGDRADPAQPRRRGGPHRPDPAAGDRRDPGAGDPGHAAAPAGGPGAAEDHRPVARARGDHRRPRGHPGRARCGSGRSSATSWPRSSSKYGDERRTEIIAADGDLSVQDLVPDEDVVVTITRGGYAKRTKTDLYRTQNRGGKGVRGAALRAEDEIDHFFATTNHHWMLFFTTKGRVYRAKVWQLPESARDAKGSHVAGLLSFQPDEEIAQVLTLRDYEQSDVPGARDQAGPGQEDRADRLRLGPAERHHRGQLPRGRRRADRRRPGHRRGRPAAGVPEGPVDPLHRERRAAAADGPGHLRRHRDEVPRTATRCCRCR